MKEKLEKIRQEALAKMEDLGNMEALNEIRVAYLGKKGQLTELLKSMKEVAPEDRPKVGQMVNEARAELEGKLEAKKAELAAKARELQLRSEVIDVTLRWSGSLSAWATRSWKARRWSTITITLKR